MPRKKRRQPSRLPQFLALAGFLLLVTAILSMKLRAEEPAETAYSLAEQQLNDALYEKKPVLAFFHSDTCQQCKVMMETVALVYPQHQENVTLVDVNVEDDRNMPLLKRVRLQFIPTLIFYDRSGMSQTTVGVMPADQLSDLLTALGEER